MATLLPKQATPLPDGHISPRGEPTSPAPCLDLHRVASGSGAVGWAAEATVTRSQASAKMLSS